MKKHLGCLMLALVLLFPAGAWAKGAPIASATEEQKEAAKGPYVEGRTAYDEGRHADALKLFQASYDIVASPNSHHMMAMAMKELGQLAQAYEHFGEVAAEADAAAATDPKYAKAAENARAKRDELMAQIGFLLLSIEGEGVSLTVAGRPIERQRWNGPIPANPGNNELVLQTGSGQPITETVSVVAGQTHRVRLAPPQPLEPEPEKDDSAGIQWLTPFRITAYAVAGAGIVSFAIAGGLGAAAQSKFDDLAAACGAAPCPQREDEISSGESLQVATNVMVVVGAALVVGGAALWWFAPDADDDTKPDVGVYIAPLPGGAMVGGTF